MSTTLTRPLPVTPPATIPPGIALARDECLEKHRERLSQKPSAFELMKNARVARSMYQRYLLRRLTRFLVSCLPFARDPDVKYPVDLANFRIDEGLTCTNASSASTPDGSVRKNK